ncbi:GntR family transcriptional regulator [Halomonas dongshanensis]|uniref:GntR family transcriptional regulator n=1 Tax=Halomonas dongshanensis TaxID=2890835 RepID=A0ABT2E9N9_9GAMM|nr:GntR family transcriptional regulator [Halomonas dongshanensis]MCS2608293.1 GntR family transcriptional regulator [Halomonas dongshanensis]
MSQTLREQLYIALKKSILDQRLEEGLVLLEGHIATLFGISRSPVRQTLSQLCEERLICRFEGRGYLVGASPGEPVRRTLSAVDVRPPGHQAPKVDRTLSWRAHLDGVEHAVVLCSIKGAFELNEVHLAKSLSVSRTVTHQLLFHLHSLGLVEKIKYSSWRIVPLDDQRLHNLYAARRQLEPYMIAQAARRLPREALDTYIARLERAAEDYPHISGALLDELENDLHHTAVSWGANAEIMNMLQRTHPTLLISKHLLGRVLDFPDQDPFFEEHLQVFESLRQAAPEKAHRALTSHLTSSESKVLERLTNFRKAGDIDIPAYLR